VFDVREEAPCVTFYHDELVVGAFETDEVTRRRGVGCPVECNRIDEERLTGVGPVRCHECAPVLKTDCCVQSERL
jgi:hypothetical protein